MDNPTNVPSEFDVNPEEGVNAPEERQAELLKEVNEATGRNYQSLEEAKKGLKETYSFVGSLGDVKEKARQFELLQKEKKTAKDEVEEKYAKIDRMEFLFQYPEAERVIEEVEALSKRKGISMKEAYDNSQLKKWVEKEVEEQEASMPSFVTSGQRLAPGQVGMSREEFAKLPLEEQKKIVEKLPGWGEKVSKGEYRSSPRDSFR